MKRLTYQEMRNQLTEQEKIQCMYSNYLDSKYFKHLVEVRIYILKKEGDKRGRDNAVTNE